MYMAEKKAVAKASKRTAAAKSKRDFTSFGRFLKDVRIELSKVNWPGREEVIASTVVVIVAVVFFAAFIGILDLVFVAFVKLFSA